MLQSKESGDGQWAVPFLSFSVALEHDGQHTVLRIGAFVCSCELKPDELFVTLSLDNSH